MTCHPLVKWQVLSWTMHFRKTLTFTTQLMTITALFKMVNGGKAIGISVLWGLNDTKWPVLLSVAVFGVLERLAALF